MKEPNNTRTGLFVSGEVLKYTKNAEREVKVWESGKQIPKNLRSIDILLDCDPDGAGNLVHASAFFSPEYKYPEIKRGELLLIRINRIKINYDRETNTSIKKVTDFEVTDLMIVNKTPPAK